MKDYQITIGVKNNYMLTCMKNIGIETASELSRRSGVGQVLIGEYINLKKTPFTNDGKIKQSVVKICEALLCFVEDLFPPQHLHKPLKKNKSSFELNAKQISSLFCLIPKEIESPEYFLIKQDEMSALDDAISSLTEREQIVIKNRFGIYDGKKKTLNEVGKQIGVTGQRIRDIERNAMSKLRKYLSNLDMMSFGTLIEK